MQVWDVTTGNLINTFAADQIVSELDALAFSSDSRTLAIGFNKTVKFWDVSTGTVNNTVAWTMGGQTIASGRSLILPTGGPWRLGAWTATLGFGMLAAAA